MNHFIAPTSSWDLFYTTTSLAPPPSKLNPFTSFLPSLSSPSHSRLSSWHCAESQIREAGKQTKCFSCFIFSPTRLPLRLWKGTGPVTGESWLPRRAQLHQVPVAPLPSQTGKIRMLSSNCLILATGQINRLAFKNYNIRHALAFGIYPERISFSPWCSFTS